MRRSTVLSLPLQLVLIDVTAAHLPTCPPARLPTCPPAHLFTYPIKLHDDAYCEFFYYYYLPFYSNFVI